MDFLYTFAGTDKSSFAVTALYIYYRNIKEFLGNIDKHLPAQFYWVARSSKEDFMVTKKNQIKINKKCLKINKNIATTYKLLLIVSILFLGFSCKMAIKISLNIWRKLIGWKVAVKEYGCKLRTWGNTRCEPWIPSVLNPPSVLFPKCRYKAD